MKRNSSESEVGESSLMLVNSLSKHTDEREAQPRDSENATLPLMTSRGQHEDSGLKKEHLQRVIELMDGFKASKVIRDKLCGPILVRLSVICEI